LTIGNDDNEDWLPQLTSSSRANDEWLKDFVLQLSPHWGEALKSNLGDELLNLLRGLYAIALVGRVHESNLDSIVVEKTGCECNSVDDELQIIDSFSILFERHGATVINV